MIIRFCFFPPILGLLQVVKFKAYLVSASCGGRCSVRMSVSLADSCCCAVSGKIRLTSLESAGESFCSGGTKGINTTYSSPSGTGATYQNAQPSVSLHCCRVHSPATGGEKPCVRREPEFFKVSLPMTAARRPATTASTKQKFRRQTPFDKPAGLCTRRLKMTDTFGALPSTIRGPRGDGRWRCDGVAQRMLQ